MFNWFKKKETDQDKLRNQTITTVVATVPVKNKAYHEIVPVQSGGFSVRVYSRKDSTLLAEVFAANKEEAIKVALQALGQHIGD